MAKTFNLGNTEITFLGHASFKIKYPPSKVYSLEFIVYIDPYNVSFGEKADSSADSAFVATSAKEAALAKADLILITHDHHDHKDEKSIEILKKETTKILIGGLASQSPRPAEALGEAQVGDGWENIQEGDLKEIKGIKIKAIPAYNLTKPFHPRGKGVGFVLEIDGKTIYHAGDTDKIPEMADLGEIDLALLPIGGTYTMDIQEAVEAIEIIKPKIVIPMHYNTLPEIAADPEKFKELVGSTSEVIIL